MNEPIVASNSPALKAISETLLAIAAEAESLESRAVGACETDSAHLLKSVRVHAQVCASKAVITYTSQTELDLGLGGALDELDAHARAARRLLVDPGTALAGRLDLLCASVRGTMAESERAANFISFTAGSPA